MTMMMTTIVTGAALTVLGVVAFVATGAASLTALIPSAVGVILLGCGLVARQQPGRRRAAVHTALGVAVVSALGSLMNVAKLPGLIVGDADRPAAVTVSTIMFVVLVCFVAAGVRSFRQART